MGFHPLAPFCRERHFEVHPSYLEKLSRDKCFYPVNKGFECSRRYSIVVTQVGILALDILFLISKVWDDAPPQLEEYTLLALSLIGITSIHYLVDIVWKRTQDAHFAYKANNSGIFFLSVGETVQAASTACLTAGNFYAAVQGVMGNHKEQASAYHNMILWGEISIGTTLFFSLAAIGVTAVTRYKLGHLTGQEDLAISAATRFCTDKDTLWQLQKDLSPVDPMDHVRLDKVLEVVKRNMDTQLTITMGGRVVLMFIGAGLEGIERYYTPNSLVSAIINVSVASAYTIRIFCEKGLEMWQRKKIKSATISFINIEEDLYSNEEEPSDYD